MADLARNRVRDRLLGRKIGLTSVELTLCWPSSGTLHLKGRDLVSRFSRAEANNAKIWQPGGDGLLGRSHDIRAREN